MSGCMQSKIEIKRKHCFTKMATTSNGNIHWLKWMAIKNDEWFEFMSHIDLHTIAFPQWRIITQKSIGNKNKKIYTEKKCIKNIHRGVAPCSWCEFHIKWLQSQKTLIFSLSLAVMCIRIKNRSMENICVTVIEGVLLVARTSKQKQKKKHIETVQKLLKIIPFSQLILHICIWER